MAIQLERFQNPTIGNDIRLRLYSYNSNNRASVDSVEKVEIYFYDSEEKTAENPEGLRLVDTTTEITEEEVGLYSVIISAEDAKYTIGNYIDLWYFTASGQEAVVQNDFQIYPNLWFTTPIPITYDFDFAFRPNRIRKGSKRYLDIEVTPNVPNRDTMISYYTNLAITSPITISIRQHCGPCAPVEEDLRLIVDEDSVELREKCHGYYFLDTTDMDVGIYDVWFQIELGENVYISDSQQLEIF